MVNNKLFFEILRYALNSSERFIPDISGVDWLRLYELSCEQAVVGVVFEGVKRLGEQGVKLPFDVLMQWVSTAEQIEGQNRLLNKRCVELTGMLSLDGFESCILKGQGNSTMYPNPFNRTPGNGGDRYLFHENEKLESSIINIR